MFCRMAHSRAWRSDISTSKHLSLYAMSTHSYLDVSVLEIHTINPRRRVTASFGLILHSQTNLLVNLHQNPSLSSDLGLISTWSSMLILTFSNWNVLLVSESMHLDFKNVLDPDAKSVTVRRAPFTSGVPKGSVFNAANKLLPLVPFTALLHDIGSLHQANLLRLLLALCPLRQHPSLHLLLERSARCSLPSTERNYRTTTLNFLLLDQAAHRSSGIG